MIAAIFASVAAFAGASGLGGVCVSPAVSGVPRAFAGCPQEPGTLTVSATGTDLQYRWRRYPRIGPGVVEIPNSNSPTLTIQSLFLSDAGEYDCVISNGCGSVTTPRYRLAVLAVDRGSQGGTQGSDGLVTSDDFIVFINQYFNHDIRADIGATGGVSLPDGLFDNNDFVSFINLFFSYPDCP